MTRELFAVISGGGTGGHLFPALAIARALEARGHEADSILLVGSRRGQEAALLHEADFPMMLLPGRGIVRRLDREAFAANAEAVAGLARAAAQAVGLLRRRRPRVVVSVGGYASFPADLAALLLGIPLVLVTVDAVPGSVHRLFARVAAANAVAFPGTALPRAEVTGVAVRPEIVDVDRGPARSASARRALGLPPARAVVGVVGGSLGAKRLNAAAGELALAWAARSDRALYHVTGRRNWEEWASWRGQGAGGQAGEPADEAAGASTLWRRLVPFEPRMDLLYEAVDVLVCRAGASTLAELAVTGVPSVLVPLPRAPGGHQEANARAMEAAGGAVVVPDGRCDGMALAALLDELLSDPQRLEAMGKAARSLGRPDAAAHVAEVVDAHAR